MGQNGLLLLVIGGVVLVFLLWYIATSNKLNRTVVKIEEADSGIDVALTKRYDVLTKMIDTVKAYSKHEKETMFEVINLRKGMTLEEKNKENSKMSHNFEKINIIAESYPDLNQVKIIKCYNNQ